MPLLEFPPDMFRLRPGEEPMYGEFPDLKKGVTYFKSLMRKGEWEYRRERIAKRFYQSLVNEVNDPSGKGKFFDDGDLFGWYLFLGEAFTDHPQNYEVVFGCRVVPVLAAIGRNLERLEKIAGFRERALRAIHSERGQPNGALFEILVAAVYARNGADVAFHPEKRGIQKSYDLDVKLQGKRWAVECKRLEAGEYHEGERERMRELWKPACMLIVRKNRNIIFDVHFKIELRNVPRNYLLDKVVGFFQAGRSALLWDDAMSRGLVGELNLEPLQKSLETRYWLHPGPQYNKMLTGSYRRYDSMILAQKVKHATNPHFIDELGLAIVARWTSLSDAAIEKKARDITKRLAEANEQLQTDVPGIIHIGFEALGGDVIERRRYEKILETANRFDRGSSSLEYIYCHYFAPEASPDETWAIDETVQWIGIRPTGLPLRKNSLILPDESIGRSGTHWDGGPTTTFRQQ